MSQAPGWYRDPFFRGQERYWDGRLWTQGTRAPEPEVVVEAATTETASGIEPAAGVDIAASTEPTPHPDDDVFALVNAEVEVEVVAAPDPSPALPAPSPDVVPSFAPLGAPGRAASAVPTGAAAGAASGGRHAAPRQRKRFGSSVLAVCATAILLVGGGGAAAFVLLAPSSASAAEAVTSAANQTVGEQSADMSLNMSISVMGFTETMTGNGAFDFSNHTGTLTATIGAAGQQVTQQAVYDGTTAYVNIGTLLAQLGGATQGKSWISMDLSGLDATAGTAAGLGPYNYDNPAKLLGELQNIGGTVTSLGPQFYEGTAVTEYSVSIPSSVLQQMVDTMGPQVEQAYAGGLPNIDEDVYVGSNDLLKGIYTPLELKVYGQEVTETMTVDFSNYGTAVSATPPPASEVIPLSQLGNDLGSGLGGSSGNTGSTGNTGDSGNTGNTGTSL